MIVIKKHNIEVERWGGTAYATHQMTIHFSANLTEGADGWIKDILSALSLTDSKETLFLNRAEVNAIREEYEIAHALAELPKEEGK